MLIKYLRDKNRTPIGVVVALGRDEIGTLQIGWSRCRQSVCEDGTKDSFNKKQGKAIAVTRALHGSPNNKTIPHDIQKLVEEMRLRASKYFKPDYNEDTAVPKTWTKETLPDLRHRLLVEGEKIRSEWQTAFGSIEEEQAAQDEIQYLTDQANQAERDAGEHELRSQPE